MDIAKQRNFLLQEIKIEKPGIPFYFGKDEKGIFTELIKLNRMYHSPEEFINDLDNYFNKKDSSYYDNNSFIKNPKYVYWSGDGELYFSYNGNNWDPDEFGVKLWDKNYN